MGQESSKLGHENPKEGHENPKEGHENPKEGQVSAILEQVKAHEKLSDKQKDVLIYMLNNPSASVKTCSEATGTTVKSIRYTFKKVKPWLEIQHVGPDKTGKWIFSTS